MDETLDDQVRRVDEDRWLASRFAPAPARERLLALYALNYEIARTAEAVSNPALGDIRLAWWAEAVEEIYSRKTVRAYPALQAYAQAVAARKPPRAPLDGMIVARGKDLDAAPFATWNELDAYLDATSGNLLRLAAICVSEHAARPAMFEDFMRAAGKAWGYAGLLRAAEFWRARGRSFFPTALSDQDEAALRALMLERGRVAYGQAQSLAQFMPAALFPAFGHVAFCKAYFAKLERGADTQTPLFQRQITLIWASATGKI